MTGKNDTESTPTKRVAPSGVTIDVVGANLLMCRTLAVFNMRAADRMVDIGDRLNALDCADLWESEAKRMEDINGN